jgi:hypothetical protein
MPQKYRGAHDVVPTGGTIGTGIGRTLGVGIGGTIGGRGLGMSSVLVHTGTCRHTPLVQSNRHTQRAPATPGKVTSSSTTQRMRSRRNFVRPVVTSQRTLPVGRGSFPGLGPMPAVKAVGTPWGSRGGVDAEAACVSDHVRPLPGVLRMQVDARSRPASACCPLTADQQRVAKYRSLLDF